VTVERYVRLQRDQARLQGDRGQLIADITRARGKIAETELQVLQLDQDLRTGVLKELRETEAKIAELQERANVAVEELKRTEIRAPQAGAVYRLQVHTVGGVVGKGETLMQIAPRADALVVEARIPPQDIDQVAVGAPVRVRIRAGNRRITPEFEGVVKLLSPDLTRKTEAPPAALQTQRFYLARISLARISLARISLARISLARISLARISLGTTELGPAMPLIAGMPAEVYIRTEDRTPLDYLLKPLGEQIARTFRER
jgi:HlyD family secretion protein